ncbi:hypothetical protein Plhal304r1_c030g0097961 [Plasmopara halstedii]
MNRATGTVLIPKHRVPHHRIFLKCDGHENRICSVGSFIDLVWCTEVEFFSVGSKEQVRQVQTVEWSLLRCV